MVVIILWPRFLTLLSVFKTRCPMLLQWLLLLRLQEMEILQAVLPVKILYRPIHVPNAV